MFLIVVLSTIALVIAAPTISTQVADNKNKVDAVKQKRREMPVVDFDASAKTNTSVQRRAKNRRYDLNAGGAPPTKFELKEGDPEELYELTPSHAP